MQFAISTRHLASRLRFVASPFLFLFPFPFPLPLLSLARLFVQSSSISVMAKATSKKQNNRADPLSKKGQEAKTVKKVKAKTTPQKEKDPKQSHLYTDDNPETTLHGTGFKDAATAEKTSKYKSCFQRSAPRPVLATRRPASLVLHVCQPCAGPHPSPPRSGRSPHL